MSGITGLMYLDGREVDPPQVQISIDRIRHRGPDAQGIWVGRSIGLGNVLLHTTPESVGERLPYSDPVSGLVIVADARIDNREELLNALEVGDQSSIPDSELILLSYARWGQDCTEKLLGDFAFAIWDTRNQELFCARDHMGLKPFYYHHTPGHLFAFGSEIKAFLWMAEISDTIDTTWLADFMVPDFRDEAYTFYQHVKRLPPAHFMSVIRDRVSLKRYWEPSCEQLRLSSDDEYEQAFRQTLEQSVRCRIRSQFPVGAELSGGLDSSSVALIASKLMGQANGALHTFSLVFDQLKQCDERAYIQRVVKEGTFSSHCIVADALNPLADAERVLWHQDGPYVGPNLFMAWEGLLKKARQHNVRVLLSGDDGDAVVSYGLPRLRELASSGRVLTLFREVLAMRKHFHQPAWPVFYHHCFVPLVPKRLRKLRRRVLELIHNGRNATRLMRVGRIERPVLNQPPEKSCYAFRQHWLDIVSPYTSYHLEVMDKAAAAFELEQRYPFYDRRFVNFCLSLPFDQKLRNGWARSIIRRAMTILPNDIRWRSTKSDIGACFDTGVLTKGRLALERGLRSPKLYEYVDSNGASECYRRFKEELTEADGMKVWSLAITGLWFDAGLSLKPLFTANSR